jgi:hypothetical protein
MHVFATLSALALCLGVSSHASDEVDSRRYGITSTGCKVVDADALNLTADQLKWEGPCVDGFLQGSGQLTVKRKFTLVYTGEFVRGEIKTGTVTVGEFMTYTGEFENNEPSGQGEMLGPDKTWIKGTFAKGKPVGDAFEVKFRNQVRYVGQFDLQTWMAEGKGTMYYLDGAIHEGVFHHNLAEGPGQTKLADGSTVSGVFANNALNGKGSKVWANGTRYEGEFISGTQQGMGKYLYADGSQFEGQFLSGQRQGRGKITWANGNTYEGDFLHDEMEGKGKMVYADGSSYEGDFKAGARSGHGTAHSSDGQISEGEWKSNELNGQCSILYSNGDKYEGQCAKNVFAGLGRMERPSVHQTYEGEFADGHYEGKGLFRAGDYEYEGLFKAGAKEGVGKEHDGAGTEYEGEFHRNLWNGHGVLTTKIEDGNVIHYDGEFMNGTFSGPGTLEAERVTLQGEFRAGVFVKGKIAAKDGNQFEIDADKSEFFRVLPDGTKQRLDGVPDPLKT